MIDGRNGSGKSSLLKLLLYESRRTHGHRVGGIRAERLPRRTGKAGTSIGTADQKYASDFC